MADLVLIEQEPFRELTEAELYAVAGGANNTVTNTFGNQKNNLIAVQAAVNVGDINVLSNSTINPPV